MTMKNVMAVLEATKAKKATQRVKESANNAEFICPICKATDFEEKYGNNGILGPGGKSFRVYCFCSGCSVVFIDPEKFSLK